jgi:hypothetical protein
MTRNIEIRLELFYSRQEVREEAQKLCWFVYHKGEIDDSFEIC